MSVCAPLWAAVRVGVYVYICVKRAHVYVYVCKGGFMGLCVFLCLLVSVFPASLGVLECIHCCTDVNVCRC